MEQKIMINAQGQELTLREGNAKRVYDYQGFHHKAFSTESFTELVDQKASKPDCIVAYDDNGMMAILDDTVVDRDQDRVSYQFKKSLQYKEWKELLEGCVMNQKAFIKFLQGREPEELQNLELLLFNIKNFKYVTNIAGDFSQDDRNNYTFMIKSSDGEGTVKIPQFINAKIEIFNESNFFQAVEIEVEVYRPKDATEVPGFKFSCPKLERYLKTAVENEVNTMKNNLPGYLIVTGSI